MSTEELHLDWSSKQGRILTANGLATKYYTAERGFPFEENDCPHSLLLQGVTHETFRKWSVSPTSICGVWNRPLFSGAWEHSTDKDEIVFNVQTNSLFVDLRIPRTRKIVLSAEVSSLSDLSDTELRYFARQHVFGGFSRVTVEKDNEVCTRHHCIDWNFVGAPRPRPNKWWIEMHSSKNAWKEWAYAKDDFDQQYYVERWERRDGGHDDGFRLALRKAKNEEGQDGLIVAVGVSPCEIYTALYIYVCINFR